jgi:transcriptional regulator with XRE-family HTH domain/tetratricopeptide (TPR) repeat protein
MCETSSPEAGPTRQVVAGGIGPGRWVTAMDEPVGSWRREVEVDMEDSAPDVTDESLRSIAMAKAAALRRNRLRAGLTQEELASRAETSVRTIANIECGRVCRPHLRSLIKLADALGLSGEDRDDFIRRPAPVHPVPAATGAARPTEAGSPEPVRRSRPIRQMPTDIRDLTGRQGEVSAVTAYLCSRSTASPPIATLTGQGGIGKTTLAIHLGHAMASEFRDGQLFVDLGGLASPQPPLEVLGQLLRALDIKGRRIAEADLGERAALFRSTVADLRLLVVLDNAASEKQVRPLLPGRGACATIVTSRSRLLALESARNFELKLFDHQQSRDLLEQIVPRRRTRPESSATDDIIRSCGGLPLAVRIAGAQISARPETPIACIARQLRDEHQRLNRLRMGDLEVRTSIGLGYEALEDTDRRALRRLAIIDMGCFSAWLLVPLADIAAEEAAAVADRLATHHLLEIIGTDPAGEPRYRLHDLVRFFAAERALREDDERERRRTVERALGLWLVVSECIRDELPSTPWNSTRGDGPRWMPAEACLRSMRSAPRDWFVTERKNLSKAVESALAHGMVGLAWQIVEASLSPCILYGEHDLPRELAPRVRAACDDVGNTRGAAAMARTLALVKYELCEWAKALDLLTAAHHLFEEVQDPTGLAFTAIFAADVARASYQFASGCSLDDVLRWSSRATALVEKNSDPYMELDLTYVLGKLFLATDDLESARTHFETCLQLASTLGKPTSEAHALFRLGSIAHKKGRRAYAVRCYRKVLAFNEEVGDRLGVAHLSLELARVLAEEGERREAIALARRAFSHLRDLNVTSKADESRQLLLSLTRCVR